MSASVSTTGSTTTHLQANTPESGEVVSHLPCGGCEHSNGNPPTLGSKNSTILIIILTSILGPIGLVSLIFHTLIPNLCYSPAQTLGSIDVLMVAVKVYRINAGKNFISAFFVVLQCISMQVLFPAVS